MELKKYKNFGVIHIGIDLYGIKYNHTNNNTVLYGSLMIYDKSHKLTYFDLDRVKIKVGKKISKKVYIDSIGDILTYKYPFRNHKISTKVYWLLPGNITIRDPRDIIIHLQGSVDIGVR